MGYNADEAVDRDAYLSVAGIDYQSVAAISRELVARKLPWRVAPYYTQEAHELRMATEKRCARCVVDANEM